VSFQVVAVLGCKLEGGRLAHASLRRIERAAQAYQELRPELVIASGGKAWDGTLEADAMRHGLIARGVPEVRVIAERQSQTTRGNARFVATLVAARLPREAILHVVTCDWHMPRALRLFRRYGIEARPIAATTPSRALHLSVARNLREHGSTALDTLFGWLRPGR